MASPTITKRHDYVIQINKIGSKSMVKDRVILQFIDRSSIIRRSQPNKGIIEQLCAKY